MKPAEITNSRFFYFVYDRRVKDNFPNKTELQLKKEPLTRLDSEKGALGAEGLIPVPIFIVTHIRGKSSLVTRNIIVT